MAAAAKSRNGRPSYEELQPRFEWEADDAASSSHVLNVFLPGFVKEQLKLTYDGPTRSLNVRGERANGTARFIRFNKDFRIPDNARLKDMRARFQSETLIVTIPKQTLISLLPLPPLPTPAQKPLPTPAPQTEVPKADDGTKDRPREPDSSLKLQLMGDDSGEAMIPMKEMKVTLEEERKLMVNVVVAATVLVAIGAYICYYTLGIARN